MKISLLQTVAAVLTPTLSASDCAASGGGLDRRVFTVRTSTGTYTGMQNPDFPNVREFRNIPYAEAPVGKRRWLPPVARGPSGQHHYSYRFPPSCPQYMSRRLSLWNSNMTRFMVSLADGQGHASGLTAQTTSEDCLSLAVWTPLPVEANAGLPVAFFMTGGSFQIGGIDVPYQLPPQWVGRSQRHMVVTINYRLNVVGFPTAAGLEEQNLGILDQRMALEWVHANIAGFGGDPGRITMWGQSAGGVSADVHSHAWPDDPLVAGYFMQSGSAMRKGFWREDAGYSNFTFVARKLGCDFPDDPVAELDCMRTVSINQIVDLYGQYADNGTGPALSFRPVPDERIVFRNYTDRALKGLIAKVPTMISNTANEQSSLQEYPLDNLTAGPWKESVDRQNVEGFVCVTSNSTNNRAVNKIATYRYQYAGNFSNTTPYWWMGAYHSSDVPMLFGTYDADGRATGLERQVSETMQDYLLAFISDPEDGLEEKGWAPQRSPVDGGAMLMRFAADGLVARRVSTLEVDDSCLRNAPYNPSLSAT